MTDPLLAAAIRNNAEWCDAVLTARGSTGQFTENLWLSLQPAPTYYPNIITLQRATPELQDELRTAIGTVRANVGAEIGVKDSFADVDLYGLGLNVLFDAVWYTRPADAAIESAETGLEWHLIDDGEAFEAWQSAWDAEATAAGPVFGLALLDDSNIAFIAGRERGDVVAGVVANAHAGVVGLSNLFTRNTHIRDDWREAIGMANKRFPGLPIVGYGPAPAVPLAETLGYSALGPLRIWTG